MEKFQNQYRIPSARATWHSYNDGIFFITICTKNRESYLGNVISNQNYKHIENINIPQMGYLTDARMELSQIGNFVDDCIRKIGSLHSEISVPCYVIMPNHVHMIISLCDNAKDEENASFSAVSPMRAISDQCGHVSHVISQFKSIVTKYANQNNIPFGWQTRFYDRIVRDQRELESIVQYIETNVDNWYLDEMYKKRCKLLLMY